MTTKELQKMKRDKSASSRENRFFELRNYILKRFCFFVLNTVMEVRRFWSLSSLLVVLCLIIAFPYSNSITCQVGYGQRGLKYGNGISWTRTCPKTKYCFEAVTSNVNNIKKLIDYPWVRLSIVVRSRP
jgi:hypothetical protein